MFAPRIAKSQTKAAENGAGKSVLQRSTLAARPFGGGVVARPLTVEGSIANQESKRMHMPNRAAVPGPAWDFSKIPLFPPDRAYSKASGFNDATRVLDRTETRDQTPGSAAPTPPTAAPAPAASSPAAPAAPTVDRIDLVNTSTGAISGYPAITAGSLDTPGPFNSATAVTHALQVHFHLDSGKSSALVPRRVIQRTSTSGGTTSMNPPDKPAPGGIGPPAAGGFGGYITGPDGPGAHEIKRPDDHKIVVADAPGLQGLAAGSFPVTYKAHFNVTVAAGSTDVASVDYDVLIDKRTATEVPNKENRSVVTDKKDMVRGQSLK